MATMTLEELLARVPDPLKPVAAQYAPTVLKMCASDLQSWLNYVFAGNYSAAYALYLKNLGSDDILGEWDKNHEAWKADNQANADQIELSKQIALAVAKVMLPLVLAAVGL